MSLATIFNPIRTKDDLAEFVFSNQDSHILVCEQLQRVFNIQIPQFVLNPIPDGDTDLWSQVHQQSHNFINLYLGTTGQDYSGIDFFEDPQATDSWTQQHGFEHREWHQILRIEVPVI